MTDRAEIVKQRKVSRDFKGRIELMKRTPIENLEKIFLELCELGLQEYLSTEKQRFPNKSRKEIIIKMYKIHDKLRGRRK